MDWDVIWSESALASAEAAVRQAAMHSPVAAEELRAALFAATDVLARFRRSGRCTRRTSPGARGRSPADCIVFSTAHGPQIAVSM